GGTEVAVPQVVVHRLVVPQALAAARVKGDDAVAEQVGAAAPGAVEVRRGRTGGDIHHAALFIHAHAGPGVGSAEGFPGILGPGVVACFAGVGNGVKSPRQFAATDIVS